MQKKKFWRIFALALVLVLCVGVFAACGDDKGSGGGTGGGGGGGGGTTTMSATAQKQAAFFDILLESANMIGEGTTVDLSPGKDISLNIGATVRLAVNNNPLPIGISIKGFIDRANTEESGNYTTNADGTYMAVEEDTTAQKYVYDDVKGTFTPSEEGTYEIKENDDNTVGAIRVIPLYKLENDNDTVIDVTVSIQGVTSLRLYYEVSDAEGTMYVTVAGQSFRVALGTVAGSMEDTVFNAIEGLLYNETLKSIIGAFGKETFNLNDIISGLLNSLLSGVLAEQGKETLADLVLGLKIGDFDVGGIIASIFGGEEKVKEYLGTNIQLFEIFKAISTAVFDDPQWRVRTANNSLQLVDYDERIKGNESAAMTAYIRAGGVIATGLLSSTSIQSLEIGFTKEAGTNGNIGRMDSFYIDVMTGPFTDGTNKNVGVRIIIDDLKVGNKNTDITRLTAAEKAAYGTFNFKAGMDIEIPTNALDIVLTQNNEDGYVFKLGSSPTGDRIVTDAAGTTTVYVPEKLSLEITAAADLVDYNNTKALITLVGTDADDLNPWNLLTVQAFPATDGFSLIAEAKADTKILPFILGVMSKFSTNTTIPGAIGENFFYSEAQSMWGFWSDATGTTFAADADAQALSYAINELITTGEVRLEGVKILEYITSVNKVIIGAKDTSGTAAALGDGTFDWLRNGLLNKAKDSGFLKAIADLVKIDAKKHEVVIGGDDALNVLLSQVYTHTSDISPTILSVIGVMAGKAPDGNIISAWEKIEAELVTFSTRGIWTSDGTPYIKVVTDNELTSGYTSVAAQVASPTAGAYDVAEVRYPTFLYENVLAKYLEEYNKNMANVNSLNTSLSNSFTLGEVTEGTGEVNDTTVTVKIGDVDYYVTATPTGTAVVASFRTEIEDYIKNTVSAAQYEALIEQHYFVIEESKLVSQSVTTIVAAYVNADATTDAGKAIRTKALTELFRRGFSFRVDAAGTLAADATGKYIYDKVAIDEAILEDLDASVTIYSDRDGKCGIEIAVNYLNEDYNINLWLEVNPVSLEGENGVDVSKIVINNSLVSSTCLTLVLSNPDPAEGGTGQ